jgi:hypothetical protein
MQRYDFACSLTFLFGLWARSRVTHPGEGAGYFFEFVVGTFSIAMQACTMGVGFGLGSLPSSLIFQPMPLLAFCLWPMSRI